MTDLLPCKVQLRPGGRWLRGLYRDNGDGTALVIADKGGSVRVGTKTYSGKFHTVPIGNVKPDKASGSVERVKVK